MPFDLLTEAGPSLPVAIYNLYETGYIEPVAALAMVNVAIFGAAIALARKVGGRANLSSGLEADPAISIEYNAEVVALRGEDNSCGDDPRYSGQDDPRTSQLRCLRDNRCEVQHGLATDMVALDRNGFVLTGGDADSDASYATSRPGIFAVGDVRAGCRCGSI